MEERLPLSTVVGHGGKHDADADDGDCRMRCMLGWRRTLLRNTRTNRTERRSSFDEMWGVDDGEGFEDSRVVDVELGI